MSQTVSPMIHAVAMIVPGPKLMFVILTFASNGKIRISMNNLLVMKFGGTSMGSAERMRVAADIITAQKKVRPVAVVVSAMSKVTDLLLETLRHAEVGDKPSVAASVQKLRTRHLEAGADLFGKNSAVEEDVAGLVNEFERIASGILMLGERPPRSVDEAIAIGERLSAVLLAKFLNASGSHAVAVNGGEVIITDAVFGNASPQMDATRAKCAGKLVPMIEKGCVPIITGFNGATADGRPTTLGRGGSDFSASILAAALDAQELVDLDRCRRHYDGRSSAGERCRGPGRSDLCRGGGTRL